MNQNIERILVKFLMNAADINDLEIVTKWLKKDAHKQLFKSYIKTNYAMDLNTNQFDTEKAKNEFLHKIRQSKKASHKLKIYNALKYAAAAVIIFGIGYVFQQKHMGVEIELIEPIIVNNQIEPGTDKATLTLETGEVVALEKGTTYQTQNATSNGEAITYTAGERNTTDIVYNTLTIPRGGQFMMTLSDGTKVWLNSETQIKYPVSFTNGQTRQVELIYGEAYFEVSPSTEHKGAEFKIYNNNQEVQVLGTEFNIKAYKNESNIYTTLVEGKVEVTSGNIRKILAPSQQSNLNVVTNSMSVQEVSLRSHISWKEGLYMFKDKSLKDIMATLSRWYDMDVVFADKSLEAIPFNGALYKDQSIIDILTISKISESLKTTKSIIKL